MGQEEAAERERVFPPYQVNDQLVSEANPDVIVMHWVCPPTENHELTDSVADESHSWDFPAGAQPSARSKAILYSLLRGE